jgi:hypothetical protein
MFESHAVDEGTSSKVMAPPAAPPVLPEPPDYSSLTPDEATFLTIPFSNLEIRQGNTLPPVIFRGGENVMALIIEFMYFGQLRRLEDAAMAAPLLDADYDLVTRLLTW